MRRSPIKRGKKAGVSENQIRERLNWRIPYLVPGSGQPGIPHNHQALEDVRWLLERNEALQQRCEELEAECNRWADLSNQRDIREHDQRERIAALEGTVQVALDFIDGLIRQALPARKKLGECICAPLPEPPNDDCPQHGEHIHGTGRQPQCPTCGSSDPEMHPVHPLWQDTETPLVCKDPFHGTGRQSEGE